MKLTIRDIEKLNPCESRLVVFKKYYPKFNKGLDSFLRLKHIPVEDKLWVVSRILPKRVVVEISCRIAESVLHLFENKHPGDKRPRLAIEAARSNRSKPSNLSAAADAYAAYTANIANAANAAAYTAYAAAYADYAAYAAKAAANAAGGRNKQKLLNLKIVKQVIRDIK